MYSTFCYKSKRVLNKTFYILYKLCFCSDVLYHDVPSCDVSYRNVAMFPELLTRRIKLLATLCKKLAYKSSGIKIKLYNTPKRHLAAFYCNIRIRRPKRKLGTSTKTKYANSSKLMMEQPRQSCHIAPKETIRRNTLKSLILKQLNHNFPGHHPPIKSSQL